ncbi:MAG: hypothetical protein JNN07_26970 [Verrucomicrobiales bacterium]|nr:hypothetical protein [Verrucomicrobiales bacterium]
MHRSYLKLCFIIAFSCSALISGIPTASAASLFGPRLRWSPTNFVPSEIKTLAIVVEHNKTPNRGNADTLRAVVSTIEQEFSEACQNKGYQLVSRSMIQQCEKELELRRLRITDREGAALAGRVLNASHLLIVAADVHAQPVKRKNVLTSKMETVYDIGSRLNCQILVTQTAMQFAACSDNSTTQGDSTRDLVPTAARVAKRIANALPARPAETLPVKNESR